MYKFEYLLILIYSEQTVPYYWVRRYGRPWLLRGGGSVATCIDRISCRTSPYYRTLLSLMCWEDSAIDGATEYYIKDQE